MKMFIFVITILLLFQSNLISDKIGYDRITKGRCEYIVYGSYQNSDIEHAGDCNYHLRLEEQRHNELVKIQNEILKTLKDLKR
jgi:hypothetical protein